MSLLEEEFDHNQATFFAGWTAQAGKNWSDLKGLKHYRESYRRLSCLHSIKNELVVPHFSIGSAAFFLEAHNDALVSHVNASFGAWRTALQALRSCIENVLCAIYYKDHPIELELWSAGKFRIGFNNLHAYALKHPLLMDIAPTILGLDILQEEYATLSKAVHASAVDFRMTESASAVLLWSTEAPRAGMWAARERKVLEGISLLMLCLFRANLQGTKMQQLRTMLSFTIGHTKRTLVKQHLKISISPP